MSPEFEGAIMAELDTSYDVFKFILTCSSCMITVNFICYNNYVDASILICIYAVMLCIKVLMQFPARHFKN